MGIKVSKDVFEVFDELTESINARTGAPKMPINLNNIDDLIWGLHKKELLIVGARPAQGKTSFLLQMAWNLAKQNIKVLFLSLEMSSHSILERLICNEMRIHGFRLRKGEISEIKKFNECRDKFISRLTISPLTITDDIGLRCEDVSEIIAINKPDVVFVDHVQRISSLGYRGKQEALSEYIQAMKAYAMTYDCAMVVASQINRSGSKEENAFDHMKGSGELEECADTLLQLNWIGRNDQSEPIEKYKVSVLKQRHGPVDSAYLKFDVVNYRFEDAFYG